MEYLPTFAGSSSTERRAVSVFAFQRIHIASLSGVVRLIRAHDPLPEGPFCTRFSYHRAVFLNFESFLFAHLTKKIPRNRGPAVSSLAFSALRSRAQLVPPNPCAVPIPPEPEHEIQLIPAPLTPLMKNAPGAPTLVAGACRTWVWCMFVSLISAVYHRSSKSRGQRDWYQTTKSARKA